MSQQRPWQLERRSKDRLYIEGYFAIIRVSLFALFSFGGLIKLVHTPFQQWVAGATGLPIEHLALIAALEMLLALAMFRGALHYGAVTCMGVISSAYAFWLIDHSQPLLMVLSFVMAAGAFVLVIEKPFAISKRQQDDIRVPIK